MKGNHGPARADPDACEKLSASDVTLGYTLLLPASAASHLKRAEVYPVSIMYQPKTQPDGSLKDKKRLTHDLSAPRANTKKAYPLCINARTDMDALIPCIFGFALLRLLHAIHALRLQFPSTRILLGKTDLEKAYRRMHVHAHIAAACIAIIGPFAHVMCRLPFGATAAPQEWCVGFEIYIDLVNELLASTD